jgi:hypothetical protein
VPARARARRSWRASEPGDTGSTPPPAASSKLRYCGGKWLDRRTKMPPR